MRISKRPAPHQKIDKFAAGSSPLSIECMQLVSKAVLRRVPLTTYTFRPPKLYFQFKQFNLKRFLVLSFLSWPMFGASPAAVMIIWAVEAQPLRVFCFGGDASVGRVEWPRWSPVRSWNTLPCEAWRACAGLHLLHGANCLRGLFWGIQGGLKNFSR